MTKFIGTVLWWDAKDGNGIIKDNYNIQYYFDSSVIDKGLIPKYKQLVSFEINQSITSCRCAHKVCFI